ncbi:hypothetical protein [Paenibacillus favisporus]|uniref:hypothetical protein n=1 Tax=Paenibacillus favisporus TaxID=221028 RepID=UPI001642FE68
MNFRRFRQTSRFSPAPASDPFSRIKKAAGSIAYGRKFVIIVYVKKGFTRPKCRPEHDDPGTTLPHEHVKNAQKSIIRIHR